MTSLTPRQAECLAAIERHISRHGVAPGVADVAEALGLRSKSGVHRMLQRLRERGRITWTPHLAHSIRVVGAVQITLRRDVLQRLAAHCAETGDALADVSPMRSRYTSTRPSSSRGIRSMGDVLVPPLDWFAHQRRDETPGTHHDSEVIRVDADPAWMHRRALGLQVASARRAPRGLDAASRHWSGGPDDAA